MNPGDLIIDNHISIENGDTQILFYLGSNKDLVDIRTTNREGEKFNIEIRLIDFLIIAETLKKAAGIGIGVISV